MLLPLSEFGHAEVALGSKNGFFEAGALASAWSPSFSINISDVTISLGAEIGSVGSIVSSSPMGTSVTVAAGVGFSVGVSFDEGKNQQSRWKDKRIFR